MSVLQGSASIFFAAAPLSRSVTINYALATNEFKGRLTSTVSACVERQQVTVKRKLAGADETVGKDRTNSSGRYALASPDPAPGTYYAKVKASTVDELTNCKSARSQLLTLP